MRNIFKLRSGKVFKNDKIEIFYRTGDVSNQLSAYLYDSEGKSHHVYWNIYPDRCSQSFNKTSVKVREFIMSKVEEWLKEQDLQDDLRQQAKQNKLDREKELIKSLMDNF